MSAPPHLLLIALLPCFAMVTPQDAAIAEIVLTLNVLKLSPQFHVSTNGSSTWGLTLLKLGAWPYKTSYL